MRIVNRAELLTLTNVIYAPHAEGELPETELCIKYDNVNFLTGRSSNDWTNEPFPITYPDLCSGDLMETAYQFDERGRTESFVISDLETGRDANYESMETEYVVYEEQDIRQMIAKLQSLLPENNK